MPPYTAWFPTECFITFKIQSYIFVVIFLELGISIESGLYISRILPGSVAAKEGNLAVGDRILNVSAIIDSYQFLDWSSFQFPTDHILSNTLFESFNLFMNFWWWRLNLYH